ncbi:MAG: hypothetical protein R3C56_12920 [Pirellulaceae bacterium]
MVSSICGNSCEPRYYGYTYGNVDPDYEATVNLGTAGKLLRLTLRRDVWQRFSTVNKVVS